MGKKGGGNEAARARADEQQRQQRIREGTTKIDETFSQFDDNFFSGRRDAYVNFAEPQLQDQFQDAQEALTFSLARQGLTDSSARGEQVGRLQQMFDTQRQQVADQALSFENNSRNAVEGSRSNLISTLNATGDAEGAASSALRQAETLTAPDTFSPLGALFADFTSAVGQQAALERANAASGGAVPVAHKTGLFAPSSGAVQVKS